MQSMLNTATGGAMPPQETGTPQPETTFTTCPNPECGSTWSHQEIEYQACDCCGYPLHHEQKAKKDMEFDFSRAYYLH